MLLSTVIPAVSRAREKSSWINHEAAVNFKSYDYSEPVQTHEWIFLIRLTDPAQMYDYEARATKRDIELSR